MEEILSTSWYGSLSVYPIIYKSDTSQVVQDFSHQQYVYTFGFMRSLVACLLIGLPKEVWIGSDGHVTHADLLHGWKLKGEGNPERKCRRLKTMVRSIGANILNANWDVGMLGSRTKYKYSTTMTNQCQLLWRGWRPPAPFFHKRLH